MSTWSDLCEQFLAATCDTQAPPAFYVKSSFDSGGNAAAILTPNCHVLAIAAQVYSDADYKHHLGAWLSTDLAHRMATVMPVAQVCNLAHRFALEGYRGPHQLRCRPERVW